MNRLFQPVRFDRTGLVWVYRNRSDTEYKGYYHWHQCCEVYFVHEGQGTVVLNRQPYEIRRGMLFLFPPYQLHHIYATVSPERPLVRTLFHFYPHLAEEWLKPFPRKQAQFASLWTDRGRNLVFDASAHAEAMEWAYDAYDRNKGQPEDIALLLLQLLAVIESVQSNAAFTALHAAGSGRSRHTERILEWIEEHLSEEIRLEGLARSLHLAPGYVSRLFREETGTGISEYAAARRMKQACHLLTTTDLPVGEIGARVGIPNPSYFIRRFKQVVGTTPLKYRKHRAPFSPSV